MSGDESKRRIGLLVPTLGGGGAERVVSRLSTILEKDYSLFLIVFYDTEIAYTHGGTLVSLGIKPVSSTFGRAVLLFRRAARLKRVKGRLRLDAVISFMDSPNAVNALSGGGFCRTVVSIRNFEEEKPWHGRWIAEWTNRRADRIVSVSEVITRRVLANGKIPIGKVVTIYNPFEPVSIEHDARESLDEEADLFFRDAFIFISVGRQSYQKGFWHLIKAFSIVRETCPRAKLVIVGRDESDGQLRDLADRLGLASTVLFTGHLENPFKYVARGGAYVMSSLFEGFPNSLVEAMACRRPVIATDCKSGPREILNAEPNLLQVCVGVELADFGLLVQALEPEEDYSKRITEGEMALAEAMCLVALDDELSNRYAALARDRASQFSSEVCREGYVDVIESLR